LDSVAGFWFGLNGDALGEKQNRAAVARPSGACAASAVEHGILQLRKIVNARNHVAADGTTNCCARLAQYRKTLEDESPDWRTGKQPVPIPFGAPFTKAMNQ
jgi:hypothetical protein